MPSVKPKKEPKTLKSAMRALVELFDDEPKSWVQGRFYGFRDAIDRIQPSYTGAANCWCLVGGVREILPGNRLLQERLMEHLGTQLPKYTSDGLDEGDFEGRIISWQDVKSRRFSQVKKFLAERHEALTK